MALKEILPDSYISICVAAVLVRLTYKYVVHPAFLSPLAKIPRAHFTASTTPLWILWKRFQGRENRSTQAAHEKYGPIVRLAPNEISVNCVEGGLRTVYAGGFEKPDWYAFFDNYNDVPNMFSTLESKPHSVRKRMMANVFSKSFINSSPAMAGMSEEVIKNRCIPVIEQDARRSTPIEVHRLWERTALDLITSYLFGLAISTDFLRNSEDSEDYFEDYYSRHRFVFYGQETPSITSLLSKFGIKLIPDVTAKANDRLHKDCLDQCDAAEKSLRENEESGQGYLNPADEPIVFSRLYASMKDLDGKNSLSSAGLDPESARARVRLEIASELFDQLSAGFETTSIALTYVTYFLSKSPEYQQKLREELASLPAFPKFASKNVDALPLLDAIIMETLRINPSIPGAQPRITPSSGTTLAGYTHIPGGVRVNAQAYSLHRNPEVFPDPLNWHPERWVSHANETESEREALAARHRWFWAFGSGGRMCIGKNFALLEMKLILAHVYSRFTTSVVDDTDIEQTDGYTSHPKGKRLLLKFEHI